MTKKHYAKLVKLLCKHNCTMGFANDLTELLAEENPRFSREKFSEALRECWIADLQKQQRANGPVDVLGKALAKVKQEMANAKRG